MWDLGYIIKSFLNHVMKKVCSLSVKTHICEATPVHYQIAMLAVRSKFRELETEILSLTCIFVYKKKISKYLNNRASTYSRIIHIQRQLELGKLLSGLPFFPERGWYCRKLKGKSSHCYIHRRAGSWGELSIPWKAWRRLRMTKQTFSQSPQYSDLCQNSSLRTDRIYIQQTRCEISPFTVSDVRHGYVI